jgi:hypothetical protein
MIHTRGAAWMVLSVLLVACDPYDPSVSPPHAVVTADGTRWYSVECRPMADCYQAAANKCAKGEYVPSTAQQREHEFLFRCRTGVRTE